LREERRIIFVFGNGKERKLNVEAEWQIGLLKRVILEVFSAVLEGCLEGDIVLCGHLPDRVCAAVKSKTFGVKLTLPKGETREFRCPETATFLKL
jgi:hypothetical protein